MHVVFLSQVLTGQMKGTGQSFSLLSPPRSVVQAGRLDKKGGAMESMSGSVKQLLTQTNAVAAQGSAADENVVIVSSQPIAAASSAASLNHHNTELKTTVVQSDNNNVVGLQNVRMVLGADSAKVESEVEAAVNGGSSSNSSSSTVTPTVIRITQLPAASNQAVPAMEVSGSEKTLVEHLTSGNPPSSQLVSATSIPSSINSSSSSSSSSSSELLLQVCQFGCLTNIIYITQIDPSEKLHWMVFINIFLLS